MKLDKFTYGKSPGALYLTLYLNEKGDLKLNRKVGNLLGRWRNRINELHAAHVWTDELQVDTFKCLLNLMKTAIREGATELPDPLCRNLVTSVLIGEIKTLEHRAIRTSKLQTAVARETPEGERVPKLKVTALPGEETYEQRIERLAAKSRQKLQRRGKLNTLY